MTRIREEEECSIISSVSWMLQQNLVVADLHQIPYGATLFWHAVCT